MSRNQRLRPLQPVIDTLKQLGALGVGNSAAGYALAFGGAITANTPTLVTHVFTASVGGFTLFTTGTLTVTYTISGVGSFKGFTISGSTTVTTTAAVLITSGSITVSYNPAVDWVP